jgi:Notch-like protein
MACAVGGLAPEDQLLTSGCFKDGEVLTVTVDGTTTVELVPTAIVNKNGRTLQGFSTGAQKKMFDGCAGCPYFDYLHYYNYYGDHDYADKMVMAALDKTPTGFTSGQGGMDFSSADDAVRVQIIKKGTAYMNAYMYVIREFEDAIDDCNEGCSGSTPDATCNEYSLKAVHAWDEGVAFYAGSLEGPNVGGSSAGEMVYRLAEKRCANFGTCGLGFHMASFRLSVCMCS